MEDESLDHIVLAKSLKLRPAIVQWQICTGEEGGILEEGPPFHMSVYFESFSPNNLGGYDVNIVVYPKSYIASWLFPQLYDEKAIIKWEWMVDKKETRCFIMRSASCIESSPQAKHVQMPMCLAMMEIRRTSDAQ